MGFLMRKQVCITLLCLLTIGGFIAERVYKTSWVTRVENDVSKNFNVEVTGTSQVDAGGSSGNKLLYITIRPRQSSGGIALIEKSVITSLSQNKWKMSGPNVLVKDSIAVEVWTCEHLGNLVSSDRTMNLYVPNSVRQFCQSTNGLVVRAAQI